MTVRVISRPKPKRYTATCSCGVHMECDEGDVRTGSRLWGSHSAQVVKCPDCGRDAYVVEVKPSYQDIGAGRPSDGEAVR